MARWRRGEDGGIGTDIERDREVWQEGDRGREEAGIGTDIERDREGWQEGDRGREEHRETERVGKMGDGEWIERMGKMRGIDRGRRDGGRGTQLYSGREG